MCFGFMFGIFRCFLYFTLLVTDRPCDPWNSGVLDMPPLPARGWSSIFVSTERFIAWGVSFTPWRCAGDNFVGQRSLWKRSRSSQPLDRWWSFSIFLSQRPLWKLLRGGPWRKSLYITASSKCSVFTWNWLSSCHLHSQIWWKAWSCARRCQWSCSLQHHTLWRYSDKGTKGLVFFFFQTLSGQMFLIIDWFSVSC